MERQLAIILFSRGITGAATRFGRFFSYLQSTGLAKKKQIYLYINSILIDELNKKNIVIKTCDENVIVVDDGKYNGIFYDLFYFIKIFYFIKEARLYRSIHFLCGGIFFVLPLKIIKILKLIRARFYISFPSTSLSVAVNGSRKWMLILYLAIKASDKIDCLNYINSLSNYVSDKNKITITPCSFSDVDTFYFNKPYSSKDNVVMFVAAFTEDKQPLLFLESVPLIDKKIKNLKYFLIGDGPQRSNICKEITKFNKDLIRRVFVEYSTNPSILLEKSKVFCSIQKNENYPSQSLLEAMLAKNYIVATNVGDTQRIVKESFAALVPNNSPEKIAEAVISFFQLSENVQDEITTRSQAFVLANCSIDKFVEYFLTIHDMF